jgi:hypothetical protein
MTDDKGRKAPDDGIWVCAACGKTAVDRYGIEGPHSSMWDESCMLNAVLCKRGDITPGQRVRGAEPYEGAGLRNE